MTKGYGQFCPIAKAAGIFCERWTALLLRELGAGSMRFSDLQKGVPLMSPSMLSRRLKDLEREGVVERRMDDGRTPTYHLTPAGAEFLPLVKELGVWGQRWTRRRLDEDEIDYGLLLWDMERTVRCERLSAGRSVVQLDFIDLPRGQRVWWFVGDGVRTELCLQDPGFEVDLYLAATVPDMIHIWRGDVSVRRALDDGMLETHGAPRVVKALESWLNLSPLAAVAPARSA